MYEGSEKLNDLNSVSNYRHEALWNSVPSSWHSGTSSKYTAVFFFKGELEVPDRERIWTD